MAMVIFATIALVSAFGWAASDIAAKGLIIYIKKNGYRPPTKKEIRDCAREATKRELNID